MFETVYDMLSSLMIWSLTDESCSIPVPSAERENEETKYRFPNYMGIVKKLRVRWRIILIHSFFDK